MTATKQDIEQWVNDGIAAGASHVIIVCDTFNHDNFPVNVQPGEDVVEKVTVLRQQEMTTVDEVYDLSRPLRLQLDDVRTFSPEITRTVGLDRQ